MRAIARTIPLLLFLGSGFAEGVVFPRWPDHDEPDIYARARVLDVELHHVGWRFNDFINLPTDFFLARVVIERRYFSFITKTSEGVVDGEHRTSILIGQDENPAENQEIVLFMRAEEGTWDLHLALFLSRNSGSIMYLPIAQMRVWDPENSLRTYRSHPFLPIGRKPRDGEAGNEERIRELIRERGEFAGNTSIVGDLYCIPIDVFLPKQIPAALESSDDFDAYFARELETLGWRLWYWGFTMIGDRADHRELMATEEVGKDNWWQVRSMARAHSLVVRYHAIEAYLRAGRKQGFEALADFLPLCAELRHLMVLQDGADLPEKHLRELDAGGGTWEVRLPPAAFAFDKNHPVDVYEEKKDYAIVYQRQAMERLEELFPSCPARDFVEARRWILDHLERMEFVDGTWILTEDEREEAVKGEED